MVATSLDYRPNEDHSREKAEHVSQHHENIDDQEKGGRTSSDYQSGIEGQNVPWTTTRIIAIASLCVVYVGSQIVLYFVSSGLFNISADLGTNFGNWMLTANTLAVAAICPFVGYITDLIGRRWVCLFGTVCLMIASIVQATAHSLGAAVAAQAIGGIGAGICELTAVAGVAEITPTRWRGVTLALVTFSIVPFMPQLLYTVLIIQSSTWRYCFLLTGLWNFIGAVGLFFCYHPPPRRLHAGLTTVEILKRVDWIGAFLSISGVTLFLVGLQAGGYQFPWTAGQTLGPLISGGLLIIGFCVWEKWGPHQYPMVPASIFKGQRVVALAFVVVFVAGMDFYSILGFFPVVLEHVYSTSLITVGIRGLSYPLAILGGACILSFLMSYTRGHVREMFLIAAAIMTAFTGALAASTPDNPATTITLATFAAFGNGALVVSALTLALYAAPDDYIGTVGALSLAVRFLGGSIGTTIFFNIFNTQIAQNLPTYVATAAVGAGASADTATNIVVAIAGGGDVTQVPGANAAILGAAAYAAQWAFSDSLKYVWYATIPFGVISCICCAFLPNIRQFMNEKVAVDIH